MNLIKQAKKQEESGDIKGAINSLKEALNQNPQNNLLQIEIGNLYAAINNYEEASGFFRRANKLFPNNDDIINGLSFCLCEIGNKYQLLLIIQVHVPFLIDYVYLFLTNFVKNIKYPTCI